jgi:hypothetical protein
MKKNIFIVLLMIIGLNACDDFHGLDVKNTNRPDVDLYLSDPAVYPSLISGVYRSWYDGNSRVGVQGATWTLSYAADVWVAPVMNWGLSSWAWQSNFVRQAIYNKDESTGTPRDIWYNRIGALSSLRDVATAILKNGNKYIDASGNDRTELILANCYLMQGVLLGDLALMFDKAYILTEEFPAAAGTAEDLKPAAEVAQEAINRLDKAIALCNNTFTNLSGALSGDFLSNNVDMAQFANFYAAKILAYMPRTGSETASVDWAKVKNYASKGITKNWVITLPDNIFGAGDFSFTSKNSPGNAWFRIGPRMINMMADTDKKSVAPWPLPIGYAYSADVANCSSDARINIYLEYTASVLGTGGVSFTYPHASQFWFRKAENFPQNSGSMPLILKTENDLLRAEVEIRLNGDKALAAQLVNLTRVNIGTLSPVTAATVTLDEVFYERFVELGWTWHPTPFFDRRRADIGGDKYALMPGTFTQLPVPYVVLKMLGLPAYTFPQ